MLDSDGKLGKISAFAVRQGTPGMRVGPEALTMGMRGSVQNALYLDGVPVGPDNLLGELGQGMTIADDALIVSRLCTAAVCLGAMKRCSQLMVRYASRRTVATGRLLNNPVTCGKLSELITKITAIETLVYQLADILDTGASMPREIPAAAKIMSSEHLNWATAELVQVLGGRGYMENNFAPQLLRDARALTIGEGPTESLNMFIGRSVGHTDNINGFLIARLGAQSIADLLTDAAERIRTRCLGSTSLFSDRSAALSWADSLIGRVAAEALVFASLSAAGVRGAVGNTAHARDWARLRVDEALKLAMNGAPQESILLTPEKIRQLVSSYDVTIGDVEQTLEGEEESTDILVRRAPVEENCVSLNAAHGVESADAGGGKQVDSHLTAAREQSAPMSTAAKRELAERLLREQIRRSKAGSMSNSD
jgi:hypothetical protein